MTAGRIPLRLLVLALAALPSLLLAESAPVYVRLLGLPVADDPIGEPRGVTADLHTGEIFVCDSRKSRILVFDAEGLFLYEIAGGSTFSSPFDVAVDEDGFLFLLANHERRRALIQLDFDGRFLREIVLEGLAEPADPPRFLSIAISGDGERLYLIDDANLLLWIIGRDGSVSAAVDLVPERKTEKERRALIVGKVDVYGDRVLVALPSDGGVRAFDLDGKRVGQYGRAGSAPCQLGFPRASALDSDGNLVIVDQQRMVIVRWDPRTNRCLGDYYGLGDAPGYLYYPADIALDPSGRIYVAQGFEGRVQMYSGLPPAARRPVPAADTESSDSRAEVEATLHGWAAARSDRHLDDFMAAYSADYRPWGADSAEGWRREYRALVEREGEVEVGLSGIEVELLGEATARANFLEELRSDGSEERRRKTVYLGRDRRGRWKITEERTADGP